MPLSEVKISILVLEDDSDDLSLITRIIEGMGLSNFQLYNDSEIFMRAINSGAHVCIIDHFLAKYTGLDILYQIKERNEDSFVIGYSGIGYSGTLTEMDIIIDYLNGDLDRFVRKGDSDAALKLQKHIIEGFKEVETRVRKTRAIKYIMQEKEKLQRQ